MNQQSRRDRRAGFTLIELMVVMVLLSVVVGGLIRVISGQQRFYRSAGDLMESRSQIRQAVSLLPSDLRGMSTVGSDIVVASDTSIGFRATIGSSVVCTANAVGNTFSFPPATLSSGQVLTVGRATPAVGDAMAVYNDGLTTGRSDDTWSIYTIRSVTNPVGGCVAPFMAAADLLRQGMVIAVNEGISTTIVQGAPVRFLRQVDYRLYTASDNKAYLGYMECPMSGGGMCTSLQPVSGPYRSFAGTGNAANGLQFQYFDSLNTEISGAQLGVRANLNNIARLRITVRGETANAVAVPGLPAAQKRDELTVHVGVRNRQ